VSGVHLGLCAEHIIRRTWEPKRWLSPMWDPRLWDIPGYWHPMVMTVRAPGSVEYADTSGKKEDHEMFPFSTGSDHELHRYWWPVAGIGYPCEWDQEGKDKEGQPGLFSSRRFSLSPRGRMWDWNPPRQLHTGLGSGPVALTHARQHYPNTQSGQNIGENKV
jgi:hypothetical protein